MQLQGGELARVGYWHAAGRPQVFRAMIEVTCDGVTRDGVTCDEAAGGSAAEGPCFAVCTGGTVNVRTGPGKEHPLLEEGFVARAGDRLLALGERQGWREVCVEVKGALRVGYMSAKYTRRATEEDV